MVKNGQDRANGKNRICGEKQIRAARRRGELMRIADLPETSAASVPCLRLAGDEVLEIENYRGVLELTDSVIRLYTGLGILRITGKCLMIRNADGDKLLAEGRICSILFENNVN